MDLTAHSRLRTHDLILFDADSSAYASQLPSWVDRVDGCVWAVVRRREPAGAIIPAGVRGQTRAERQAIEVRFADIRWRVTPESLLALTLTNSASPRLEAALSELCAQQPTWAGERSWGPTGSVGFQLATGLPVVSEASDLDIILRADRYLSPADAMAMSEYLGALPCPVDCLLETAFGAVALAEWASSASNVVVLRTPGGPRLTRNPWKGDLTVKDAVSL